jgi:tetratricopeptide (TPR) repeat protein
MGILNSMNAGILNIAKIKLAFFMACVANLATAAESTNYGKQFGPFDYYNHRTPASAYGAVESVHFGVRTELLLRQGNFCNYWSDLDYTLRAFPNHPKALMKMAEFLKAHVACEIGGSKISGHSPLELAEQIESGQWQGRTMEYYFEKAIQYRPEYTETRLLYARALVDVQKRDQAIAILTNCLKLHPGSSEAHYDLGMLYFGNGDLQSSLQHARRAYQLGKPPAELRSNLVAAGVWKQ